MRLLAGHRSGAVAVAVTVGLALVGVARAQEVGTSGAGLIVGEVDRCINGAETPASQVAVGVVGGSGNLGRTDTNGQFVFALPAGQYTIVANADDGTSANRQYVPVEAGQVLDIGIIDLGAGIAGCGPDSDITAPVLPTFTSTESAAAGGLTATAVATTPTPAPMTPPATATAVPGPTDQPMPTDQPADSGG